MNEDEKQFYDFLLTVAKATDDRLAETGTPLEPQFGTITMVLAANGGEMDEEMLSAVSHSLVSAAAVAKITGRQPIYEFIAETLVVMSR